jgi:hypothetical protein
MSSIQVLGDAAAISYTESLTSPESISDQDGRKVRWTLEDDRRLVALKDTGSLWLEIKKHLPQVGLAAAAPGDTGDTGIND